MIQHQLSYFDFEKGEVLLVDKPLHWTSFDVVKKIRTVTKTKTGHAGTLDPLATGLLILCTGKFTKRISEFQERKKEYIGTFFLGATTPSFDLETEISERFETSHITEEIMHEATKKFTGEILQTPPIYSAVKIDGKSAYISARKGIDILLEPRKVFIEKFEITKIELPNVEFLVVCSKGTYIRSLAIDFGKELKSGAYLASLCRTKIGEFKLEDSWNLEDLVSKIRSQKSEI